MSPLIITLPIAALLGWFWGRIWFFITGEARETPKDYFVSSVCLMFTVLVMVSVVSTIWELIW